MFEFAFKTSALILHILAIFFFFALKQCMEIEYSLLTTHYSVTSYYKYVVYIYQICEEAENFLTSLKYDHCGFF